jgi:polyribonucleotide nucleotidyltransferase
VRDQDEKRAILSRILEKEDALDQLDARVAGSWLFRVDVAE